MDLANSYRMVRYAPEVIDVVHFGDRPAVVGDELISELRRWAGDEGEVITAEPGLRTGEMVEVTDGPMQGVTAMILYANDDRDRVAILLMTLQCGGQLTISRSQLRRISVD